MILCFIVKTRKEIEMKKGFIVFASLLTLVIATNAFAEIGMYHTNIYTDEGLIQYMAPDDVELCGTNCIEYFFTVPWDEEILATQASVKRNNPAEEFDGFIWRRKYIGSSWIDLDSMPTIFIGNSIVYTSEYAQQGGQINFDNCDPIRYLVFQYLLNGSWHTIFFTAVPSGC
jgi:hypothetical protein